MLKASILTISDKGFIGEREDITGKIIKEMLKKNGYQVSYYKIIPDDIDKIADELIKNSDELKVDLILTNGGTGFSKRDVTPEATKQVIQKEVPGISEAMRIKSMEVTPKAILSREISGIRNSTLIINLPGSPKGASENLHVVMPVLKHGIDILKGNAKECAR